MIGRLPRFALLMVGLIALAAFPQSALFTVQRVDVVGVTSLDGDALLEIAGIRRGDRLFALDVGAARRRLRADPRVAAAELWLRPPRAIVLQLIERRPGFAVRLGAAFALAAADLVVVRTSDDAGGLPVVIDRTAPGGSLRPGAQVSWPGVRAARDVLDAMPAEMLIAVREVQVAAGPDVTVALVSGLEVRVGGPSGAAARLAQVPGVVDALRAKGMTLQSIDLRYAGSVAVRVIPGGDVR